jgi:hypothetical protein
MSSVAVVSRPPRLLVTSGAIVGLTWAAALRGWMAQMAGDASRMHWFPTFALLLAPGLCVGALIGLAEHRRRIGASRSGWLVLSPCLLLSALADPTIFKGLVTSGIGGGSIGVVLVGLAGGYALSGRGRAWWRRTCGLFGILGLLLMLVMASDNAPLRTAHGLWVGLLASSLVAVLMLGCAVPQRIGRPTLVPDGWVAGAVGALCGLAWAAALRAFMWEVAGPDARAEWAGTFVWVLLPGVVVGALLARAEHRRWTGPVPHRRWLVWSPMLFGAVLLQNPVDLVRGFAGGVGLSAVAVPAMCMLGGYAIAGRGPHRLRGACGLVALAAIPIWSLTATDVGGASMSLGNPHGAWAAVLFWCLLTTFSMAAAIPHRENAPEPPGRVVGAALDRSGSTS